MAKPRHPMRATVMKKYIETLGKISTAELAEMAGVSQSQIRKWKATDDWKGGLAKARKPKRGGQRGNKNASGHGAPLGNTNAEKHGAYSEPRVEGMTDDELKEIESTTLDVEGNLLGELKILRAKRIDLEKRLAALDADETDLYPDQVVREPLGETEVLSTKFQRRMALENAYNRVHGRIIKLLDSIKNYEIDNRKIALENEKIKLAKQRASGIFEIDDTEQTDGTEQSDTAEQIGSAEKSE